MKDNIGESEINMEENSEMEMSSCYSNVENSDKTSSVICQKDFEIGEAKTDHFKVMCNEPHSRIDDEIGQAVTLTENNKLSDSNVLTSKKSMNQIEDSLTAIEISSNDDVRTQQQNCILPENNCKEEVHADRMANEADLIPEIIIKTEVDGIDMVEGGFLYRDDNGVLKNINIEPCSVVLTRLSPNWETEPSKYFHSVTSPDVSIKNYSERKKLRNNIWMTRVHDVELLSDTLSTTRNSARRTEDRYISPSKKSQYDTSNKVKRQCKQCEYTSFSIKVLKKHVSKTHEIKENNFKHDIDSGLKMVVNRHSIRKTNTINLRKKAPITIKKRVSETHESEEDEFNDGIDLATRDTVKEIKMRGVCKKAPIILLNKKYVSDTYETEESKFGTQTTKIPKKPPKIIIPSKKALYSKKTKRRHCKDCGYTTVSLDRFRNHVNEAHNKKDNSLKIQCKGCEYTTFHSKFMKNHIIKVHGFKDGVFRYQCEECECMTSSKKDMRRHARLHKITSIPSENKDIEASLERSRESNRLLGLEVDIVPKPDLPRPPRKNLNNAPVTCSVCKKTIQARYLPDHMHIHTGGFSCDLCGYKNNRQYRIDVHKRKYHDPKFAKLPDFVFSCEKCDFRTLDNKVFTIHIKDNHKDNKKYKCDLCNFSTNRLQAINGHQKVHEELQVEEEERCEDEARNTEAEDLDSDDYEFHAYCCEFCKFIGYSKSNFDRHMKSHEESPRKQDKVKVLRKFKCNCGEICVGKEKYVEHRLEQHSKKCPACDFRSYSPKKLKEHFLSSHEPNKCRFCDFWATRRKGLTRHLREKHNKRNLFECEYCEYKSKAREKLLNHTRRHTGEKPFKCKYCSYEAATKKQLTQHESKHTGEKLFKCTLCTYKGTRRDYLRSHMRTHTGEKPYSCTECEYRGSNKSSLNNHMKIHTGPKPLLCNLCNFVTAVPSSLEKHFKIHESNDYVCQYCGYSMNNLGGFASHLSVHNDFLPFKCFHCDFLTHEAVSFAAHARACGKKEDSAVYNHSSDNFKTNENVEMDHIDANESEKISNDAVPESSLENASKKSGTKKEKFKSTKDSKKKKNVKKVVSSETNQNSTEVCTQEHYDKLKEQFDELQKNFEKMKKNYENAENIFEKRKNDDRNQGTSLENGSFRKQFRTGKAKKHSETSKVGTIIGSSSKNTQKQYSVRLGQPQSNFINSVGPSGTQENREKQHAVLHFQNQKSITEIAKRRNDTMSRPLIENIGIPSYHNIAISASEPDSSNSEFSISESISNNAIMTNPVSYSSSPDIGNSSNYIPQLATINIGNTNENPYNFVYGSENSSVITSANLNLNSRVNTIAPACNNAVRYVFPQPYSLWPLPVPSNQQ